jgi:cytochrome P450
VPNTKRPLLYNPFDPALRADPYPLYRRLRDEDPVHRSPLGFWALSRYADIVVLQRDTSMEFFGPQTLDRLKEAMKDPSSPAAKVGRWLLFTDHQEHRRFRGLMGRFFTPRAVQQVRPLVTAKVAELLDRLPTDQPVDLVAEFAKPLPMTMFSEWLGIPPEDREQVRQWAASIGRILVSVLNPEMIRKMADAVLACDAYLRAQIAERRRAPRDDLLSELLGASHGGETISDDELVANVILLLGATYETTVNMLGNSILALLQHPDQRELLRGDRSVITNAVDELLHYDSPAQLHGRYTPHDLEIGGKVIPAKSRIILLIGAANRDPERFADPDQLDLRRPDPRPLSFGTGVHACLGAWVARLESEVALSMLLDRFPTIGRITEPLQWRPEPAAIRALRALPVELATTSGA